MDEPAAPHKRADEAREIIVVVLLSLTAILTAWCGFESSKWGGCPVSGHRKVPNP